MRVGVMVGPRFERVAQHVRGAVDHARLSKGLGAQAGWVVLRSIIIASPSMRVLICVAALGPMSCRMPTPLSVTSYPPGVATPWHASME